MYYVYIIKSEKDGSHYTGLTTNLSRRLRGHNKSDTKTTKSRKPWRLIYTEEVGPRAVARSREKYLKSGAGREWRNGFLPG